MTDGPRRRNVRTVAQLRDAGIVEDAEVARDEPEQRAATARCSVCGPG
jgi:hypothetical protein